ncbi:ROK family protein [Vagococcus elongatus]|uniref:ROK family protein n=1 Tax=Vagococcus elongatus TaxID=180344 RepID=A0A430AMM0_9ENTE|nr:ROK family protein [Vagococcus elongatus]RSU09368.1 hypothetical protein CBF29_11735 [Vagococcus elongatus]
MLKDFHELSSAKDMRLKQLYRTIRKLGKSDITLLKEETGFKHATCVRMLEELLSAALIDDSDVGESSGGRKPKVYQINAAKNILVGAEISQLYTTVLFTDLNLDIISVRKLKMSAECSPMVVLDFITDGITEMLMEIGRDRSELLGIGVGILSRIDVKDNSITGDQYFSELGWDRFNIVNYLERSNLLKVLVDSATNLAALAEYRKNHWRTTDSLLFVASDFKIRSAVILNGKLLYNQSEMNEGVQHMVVDIAGRSCSCGAFGCLKMYATVPVIFEEVIKKIKLGYLSSLTEKQINLDELSYHHVLQGIDDHDPLCLEAAREAAGYLGVGISNLILQLRPTEVILGGTLGPRLYEWVEETVTKRNSQLGISDVQLHLANASFNTVSQGAACLVIDYFVEEKNYI